MSQCVFKRYELKYILTKEQYYIVINKIKEYLSLDKYGEVTIQSLYYDTDNYRLIRNSIERPIYKEKIRLRSYGLAKEDSKVFLELKKKYEKIVYKRRIELNNPNTLDLFSTLEEKGQIGQEIKYFCDYYGNLKPSMLLLYDREAYINKDLDLRITFDRNVRYRNDNLNLTTSLDGINLLDNGEVLMEIKTSRCYPLWLVRLLNNNKIYKSRFSKYGTAYQLELKKRLKGVKTYA